MTAPLRPLLLSVPVLVVAVVAATASGCAGRTDHAGAVDTRAGAAETRAAGTSDGRATEGLTLVASARAGVSRVQVHSGPGGPVRQTLANPNDEGAPTTFMVLERRPGWLRVQLPARPGGSQGWVAEDQVTLSGTRYRLVAHRAGHTLELWHVGRRVASYRMAVGKAATPTPTGTYFVTEVLRLPNPSGPYGPYALGLSAYSPTLEHFAGGPGQIGLHGTDAPQRLGTDASHGCLRVDNSVITELAHRVPIGTPVDITA